MAGPVWGNAEIRVTADGDILPVQIRRLAKQAGEDGGKALGKGMNDSFDKETKKGLQARLKKFFKDLNKQLKDNAVHWKDLSHNTRQWSLIIGAVAAAIPDIAGLLSAAGVGVLALGSALGSAGIGVGVAVAAFRRFTGDMKNVPAEVRPARKAFDQMKKTFSDLNEELTKRVFRDTEKAWKNISDTVKGLEGPLGEVADVVNDLIQDFAENLKPGTENFRNLAKYIENSAPIFDQLVRSVGTFGSALLTAFTDPAMVKAVEGLVGWIDDLATGFDNFVNGDAYSDWVTNGASVFEHIGGLIEAIGEALSGLFDEQSTDNLNDFIDGLAEFLRGPGKDIIDFLDQLDIPGIVIDVLNNLGEVLGPIARGLTDIIKANPEAVATGLSALATAFLLFKGLSIGATLVTPLTNLAKIKGLGKLAGVLGTLAYAVETLFAVFEGREAPLQNLFDLDTALLDLTASLGGLGFFIGGPLGAAIGVGIGYIISLFTNFEDTFNQTGTNLVASLTGGAWGPLTGLIADFFAGLVPPEWAKSDNPLEQVMAAIALTIQEPGTALTILVEEWPTAWAQFTGAIETGFSTLGTLWNNFWGITLPNALPTAWEMIKQKVKTGWDNLLTTFSSMIATVKSRWDTFWNGLSRIVSNAWNGIVSAVKAQATKVQRAFSDFFSDARSNWDNFWNGLVGIVSSVINTIKGIVNGLLGPIQNVLSGLGRISGSRGSVSGGVSGAMASGGVLTGPRRILAGEAGPEAIVPLNRALSQVDPSVRWLSAIAQNKSTPAMASGGVVGGGRIVNIDSGAIVIQGAIDPQRTSLAVLNRVAERVAG